jgi:adenosylhomocysteine nucleosidase
MSRVAIIAALHREIASLVPSYDLQRAAISGNKDVSLWTTDHSVVAIAGMGANRAALAVESALSTGPISEILSVGWAGGCGSGIQVGSVLRPSTVVDVRTGERFQCVGGDGSTLATVAAFAGPKEKRRLHEAYGATAVDMEAATVARLAEMRKLPFRAVKAISDAEDFELPGIERFHTEDGQFREAAFGLHVALRPRLWRPVLKMAKGSKLAAENLCAELGREIERFREMNP